MLDQGAVILSSADWPHGVRIVLITSDTGKLCGKLSQPSSHPTHFNITVGPNGSDSDTLIATVIVTVFYLLIALITVGISCIVFKCKFDAERCRVDEDEVDAKNEQSEKPKMNWKLRMKQFKRLRSVHMELDDKKRLPSAKNVAHFSNELKDKTKSKAVYKKSRLYLGALWLVSIFYSLPTIQMVFRLSHEQEMSGSQDICYYNELCKRSLGSLTDFNHLFSNLGYCVFGLLFMLIVKIRKQEYKSFEKKINRKIKDYQVDSSGLGVPRQYGLYYAMGLALAMEGVMSACYHVCPTKITFQFDTTFMYLIAILMFMKLYQVTNPYKKPDDKLCSTAQICEGAEIESIV